MANLDEETQNSINGSFYDVNKVLVSSTINDVGKLDAIIRLQAQILAHLEKREIAEILTNVYNKLDEDRLAFVKQHAQKA